MIRILFRIGFVFIGAALAVAAPIILTLIALRALPEVSRIVMAASHSGAIFGAGLIASSLAAIALPLARTPGDRNGYRIRMVVSGLLVSATPAFACWAATRDPISGPIGIIVGFGLVALTRLVVNRWPALFATA